jgi:hypothetical protein
MRDLMLEVNFTIIHRLEFIDVVLVRSVLMLVFIADSLKLSQQIPFRSYKICRLRLAVNNFSFWILRKVQILLIGFLWVSNLWSPLRHSGRPQHLVGLNKIGLRGSAWRRAAIGCGWCSGRFLLIFVLNNQLLASWELILLLELLCLGRR